MKKKAFITSTGTNIGKTFLTKMLINRSIELNYKVSAIKPIISGFNKNNFDETDTGIIVNALNTPKIDIDKISPWRFKEPLSPDLAAKNEGKYINFEELLYFCEQSINSKNNDLVLVEGVGGTMVPINDKFTIMDLIIKLNIPVILTIGSYLGSISHTLNAYEILDKYNININSIVVMQSESQDVGVEYTINSIKNHIKKTPIIFFKRDNLDYIKVDKIIKNL